MKFNLTRIVQVVWLFIAAVCAVEAYTNLTSAATDKSRGYIFIVIGILALFRFIMLRRMQIMRKRKLED